MSVFRPYVPFLSPDPYAHIRPVPLETALLDHLAEEFIWAPAPRETPSEYATALSAHFAARYRGEMANAAAVLVLVVVGALHGVRRLPQHVGLGELRTLVLGVIGRLRCFYPPSAETLLELLSAFWQLLSVHWAVPNLASILDHLQAPTTVTALQEQLRRTAEEAMNAFVGDGCPTESRHTEMNLRTGELPPGDRPVMLVSEVR